MHYELHHYLLLQLDFEHLFFDGDGYLNALAVWLRPYPYAVHDAAAVSVEVEMWREVWEGGEGMLVFKYIDKDWVKQ